MKWQRSSFFLFTISFLISLGILVSVMAVVLSVSARNRGPEAPAGSTDLSAQGYRPSEEDGFRVLIIYAEKETAKGFAVLSADPMAAKVTLLSLPGELNTELDGRSGTLFSQDAYAGSAQALGADQELLGLKIHRWIRVERRGAVNMIDALGGMEWEFSEPLNTRRLSVPVGRHLLDGETVLALIEARESGEPLPDTIHVAASLLGQRLTQSLLNIGDWFFQVLVSNTQGNISQFDYQGHKKMLRWYLTNENRRLQTLSVTGELQDGKMVLSAEDQAVLRAELGERDT